MRRLLAIALAGVMLLGVAQTGEGGAPPSKFSILGATIDLTVTRGGMTLPATLVPYLKPGDTVAISFPRGVQYSRSPRWHLVVAEMYRDYLAHAPRFPISDANLSSAKPGHVWTFRVASGTTPLIFLVPENGSERGRGIPAARSAIAELQNRSLLLHTATLSANAQVKQTTLGEFLHSLSSLQPNQLSDGRSRVAAATQRLFGYDLSNAPCFDASQPQSTQAACVAQAVASNYDNVSKPAAVAAVGSELPVGTATYGMLLGTIYELLQKRRVEAQYQFVPGVLNPGDASTDVYVGQQPQYDASAQNPSTIVYFAIGSHATSPKTPVLGPAPELDVCAAQPAIAVQMPFSGLPVYFRNHEAIVAGNGTTFDFPATYDPLTGFHATLSPQALTALRGGGSVTLASGWGFDELRSPPETIVEPHPAVWTTTPADAQSAVMGDAASTFTLSDGGAHQGSCVEAVSVRDATGATIPVTDMERTNDTLTLTLDTSKALGPTLTAAVTEYGGSAGAPVPAALLPQMPKITNATAYLPKGVLTLQGEGLKYIDTVTLEGTGIAFGSGTPNADGSWSFTMKRMQPYDSAWEHETMAISYKLEAPDPRTGTAPADVVYSPAASALLYDGPVIAK